MNAFRVKYFKTGKPKGARGFLCFDSRTYEDVLFTQTINNLCMPNYQTEYWYVMLNEHIFIKRLRANSSICIYEVQLFDMSQRTKFLVEYQVEIECVENDGCGDILEQEQEIIPIEQRKPANPTKSERLTEWYSKEPRAVRIFLFWLNKAGSLEELKKTMPETMSKATYYRNLKLCREKGFIKGNKMVKRIFINKIE
jgi:hypothetical protein